MEKNEEYGLIYTRALIYDYGNKKFLRKKLGENTTTFKHLLQKCGIPTLTVCFRRELVTSFYENIEINPKWYMGDYPIWLWISLNMRIYFLDEVTAVYNYLPESASHSKDGSKRVLFNFSSYNVFYFFAIKYLAKDDIKTLVNERFLFLFLSIMKHRSFSLIGMLIKTFNESYSLLNFKNKFLYNLLHKLC